MSALFCLLLSCIIGCVFTESVSNSQPEYMTVFEKHQRWEGTYVYNGTTYFCALFISSQHHIIPGLLSTLRDTDGASVELEGTQVDDKELELMFTVYSMFNDVKRFPMNFTFHCKLHQENDKWEMEIRITVPENGLFGEMILKQSDQEIGPWFDDGPEAWRYVVIIGIPIILAVIGVAGTIAIIYWAIKKGYIRHVPKSYDNFDNPAAVQYDANSRNVQING